ncbi:N-acyl homoserine lactonase family protein [Geodermatophilus sp. SYSU D00710]
MTGGRARRLFVLTFGAELIPKSLSVAGDPDTLFWAPITGALVETDAGWVLFDSGMRRANHDDARVDETYRGGRDTPDDGVVPPVFPADPEPGRWTWGRDGEPLKAALSDVGLTVGDLGLAVISHLHWDHAGGIGLLAAAGVPVALHEDEIAFARSGAPRFEEGFDRADWAPVGDGWVPLSGDTEVAPGVTALSTPGHTPGHVSLRVDLPQTGTWLFPSDAAELAQNWIDRRGCGSTTGSTPELARASMDRLAALAAATDARIVCGHDPVVTRVAEHPPGGHR